MIRPKSASDAQGFGREGEGPALPEPMASPTKGILMTPGTAAAKRKTVTFGDSVLDNDDKRPPRSGLPDDCPGKFPSPWTKSGTSDVKGDQAIDAKKGKSKLTEALEQARDESAKKTRSGKEVNGGDDNGLLYDVAEPKSESGRYWKTQYDIYRQNTQREVRKLVTKQKSAKSFAKEKDFQCTALADELRQEKRKVERLERRTADLEAQLKELQRKLQMSHGSAQKVEQANIRSHPAPLAEAERAKAAGARPNYVTTVPAQQPTYSGVTTSPRRNSKDPSQQVPPVPPQPVKQVAPEAGPRPRSRPESTRTKTADDIWAQSLNSSTLSPNKGTEKPSASPRGGRMVTSGTNLTPLKSLSINTLPVAKLVRKDSAQPSPPAERNKQPPFPPQNSAPSPRAEGKTDETIASSPSLPLPFPEPAPTAVQLGSPSSARKAAHEVTEDMSMPLPLSSPFQPIPAPSPQPKPPRTEQQGPTSTNTVSRKENVSPGPKPGAKLTELEVKPSAAWNAINAPIASKRVTSLVDKAGNEVGVDRLEAARARIAARARAVS